MCGYLLTYPSRWSPHSPPILFKLYFIIILLSIARLSQWPLSYPLAACIFAPSKLATWSTFLILDFLMLICVEGKVMKFLIQFSPHFCYCFMSPDILLSTLLKTPLAWVPPLIWNLLWFYSYAPGKCCSISSTSYKLGRGCFLPHLCHIHHSLIILSFNSM